jgi:hypothetical protein
MKIKKLAAAALALASTAHAYNVGTPTTYSALVWATNLNAPLLIGCNQLIIDGTGDLTRSSILVVAGTLNCPSLGGGYGVTGSLYLGTDGTVNVTMVVAGYTVACPRVIGWNGACNVIDSQGTVRGTGSIRLL